MDNNDNVFEKINRPDRVANAYAEKVAEIPQAFTKQSDPVAKIELDEDNYKKLQDNKLVVAELVSVEDYQKKLDNRALRLEVLKLAYNAVQMNAKLSGGHIDATDLIETADKMFAWAVRS